MAYCPQCGAPFAEGTRYCTSCGTALGPVAPPGAPPAPAPQGPKDTRMAQTLLLVGAILGVLVPLFVAMMLLAFGSFAFGFGGEFPAIIFAVFGIVMAGLGILWGALALYARGLLQGGEVEKGATLALVAGALMFVTGGVFGGVFVLAGGILAHGAR